MRALFIIILLITSSAGVSYAEDDKMIPLRDFMTNSFDELGGIGYLIYRCAGLNSMQYAVISSRSDEKAKETLEIITQRINLIYQYGFQNFLKSNKDATLEDYTANYQLSVQPISDKYMTIANNAWIRSGEYFSDPLVQDDTQVCLDVFESN